MTTDKRGLDHAVLVVRDLDAARRRFENFGFTTTPPARHPFGTGNSLVQLGHSFIELLTVVAPDKIVPTSPGHFSFSAFNADFLGRREGMSMLVLTSSDARADNTGWAARGLETYAPVDFSRDATLADGTRATVAFTIAFALDPTMPDTGFFVCQQHRPENFWQPVYQSHRNGACDLSRITMVAPDPASHRGFFEAFMPEAAVSFADDSLRVELPRGVIEVLRPQDLARRFAAAALPDLEPGPRFVAAAVTVAGLDAAEAALTAGGVAFERRGTSIQVAADRCFGMVLELEASP
jgi:catechol 2,3-dioxygenase-like lactoylglutathione lyase family enzyme